jgi:uncharacterized SAM-binding protein YcdF (DUF218 family)
MKNQIKLMKYAGIIGAIVILMSSCLMHGGGNKYKKTVQEHTFDVIIVPGYPFEDGKWSIITKLRVYWAAYLYENGITKNIIFSGSSVYTPYVESRIMSLYAQELGVPASNIYTEEQAEHSSENLYYSYKMAKREGFDKVALTTDPFQTGFLKPFIKKMGLNDLILLPINFKKLKMTEMENPEIDPSTAFVEDFSSLISRQNSATRKMGTKGKFIKYEKGDSPNELKLNK